ncbi:carcinine hydrolase/isopenicillin-N N-acyltransferase family protein [Faecalibacterium sp. CLA-AA-H233]|uniref:Carcinine hydrolase/isopenicillin-N N-acyltransferase family protein n=1 Tax=Faecalibacterium butyricigenerans TaxID=1851427 RepID=A0ABS8F9B2_9FIRM|nr:C45 family peptidase [Faecalibacterium sp. CLA-AA-H233]MCC2199722.1 carcinine hydrolase/isopenicillin-N N-acyltransferase family protein [Faecalibacterium sp. CLA-AA-H233]
MKRNSLSKLLRRIACALAALVIALAVAVFALWHNELTTLASFQKLSDRDEAHRDGAVYQINFSGDYFFDEFLSQGGASNDAELISFVTRSITKGIIPMHIKTSSIACSAFTADTQSGDRVFGRNYDFSATNTAIVYTDPGEGRHASYSTIDLSFLGLDADKDVETIGQKFLTLAAPYVPLDGINDAGVACGIFMSYQGEGKGTPTDTQTDRPDITSTTLLRLILDYADSVEDAVALAQQYDLHDSASSCFHYMVADSTGRSAILEWVGTDADHDVDGAQRQLNVLWNDTDALSDSVDWQVVTNFIKTPGYYDGTTAERKGLDRYEHLTAALRETDGIVADKDAAMDLLASVGRRTWDNDDSNSNTVHSVVYDLTDKSVLWVGNEHYGEEAYTFEFQLGR